MTLIIVLNTRLARLEMDRDGCPRVINLGSSKKGHYYEPIKKGDIKLEQDGKRKMVN